MRKVGARLKLTPQSLPTGLGLFQVNKGVREGGGFEVVDAGIQIFEKKPKEVRQEVSSAEVDASI